MKKKSPKIYARALYEAVKDLRGVELKIALDRFVQLLHREAALKKADRILAEFERYGKEQEGIVSITVTSSRELAAATLNSVKKVFSAPGGSAFGGGKTVEATEKVDPKLLGGVVIRTKDTILDGSLRTQLNSLKMKLCL